MALFEKARDRFNDVGGSCHPGKNDEGGIVDRTWEVNSDIGLGPWLHKIQPDVYSQWLFLDTGSLGWNLVHVDRCR